MKSDIKRIALWSGPRNISTALMYSFAQRSDTKVFDEPLYAHYLNNTKAHEYHPGAQDVLRTMENDGNKVIDMMVKNSERPVIFYKNMTHHLLDLDRNFMKEMVNVILSRDPLEMLPSFAKVIPNPTMDDVGYRAHIDLIQFFKDHNIRFVVMDGMKTLLNPEGVLKQLCEFAGIDFDPNMLQWEPHQRPEDGVWAQYWYASVQRSRGFAKYNPKTEAFPEHLEPLLKASRVI